MVLQELFDNLASGEFSGLALANSVTGSIKEEAYPKVINAVNRGLTEIYKRFLLKKKKVFLVQQEGLTYYYLRTDYLGFSNFTSEDAYLLDHPAEEFQNDILRVLNITDEEDNIIPLNPSRPHPNQTFFQASQFDILNLVTSNTGQTFTVEYQAKYPRITITETFDPETYQLYYPPFIEDILINYVASLLVKGKTTKASEGEGYASNTFAAKYEKACLKLIELGLAEESSSQDFRFERKGFV